MITRWQEVRLKTYSLALPHTLPCRSLPVRLVPFLVNRWPPYLDFTGFLPFISTEESKFELPMKCKYVSQHPKRMVSKSGEAKIIF